MRYIIFIILFNISFACAKQQKLKGTYTLQTKYLNSQRAGHLDANYKIIFLKNNEYHYFEPREISEWIVRKDTGISECITSIYTQESKGTFAKIGEKVILKDLKQKELSHIKFELKDNVLYLHDKAFVKK